VTGDTQAPGHRLARLGLTLPEPPLAVAAFQPCVRSGPAVYVSGQVTVRDGQLVASGRLGVGAGIGIGAGQAAARVCALSVLAQLHAAAGAQARSAIGVDTAPPRHPGLGRGHRRARFLTEGSIW
jgi:enamine deaminase RidA (YjgF/YER057c/UK114 family)